MTEQNDTPPAPAGRPGSNLPEFTIAELTGALKRTIEGEFGLVRVRAEIGKVTVPRSGHVYLTLKDDACTLESVIWKGQLARLMVRPEQGMEVICTGRLTIYGSRSQYQMVIEQMELAGEGAILKMLEERRRRLAAEGLFEAARKRALPFLPRVIGVVTSPTGAVIRDILHRLSDRFPRHVLVWPVAVQGDSAAGQVAAAIEGFNALSPGGPVPRPDLLIVARGGGSLEDLMPFNEEIVVRAAAASTIPLISAVGHETDTTLIDYAADRRDQGEDAGGGGADHDLLVERPEVLQRAAAARDDQQIGPRDPAALRQRVEAADRGRDLLGRAFALHLDRPHQHAAGKTVLQPMQDVADHGAGRRGHDADHLRQPRQELLARLVEQAFGCELLLALLHQRHQRADAGGLQRLDHDLVFRGARIGRELAGGDDLEPLLGLEAHAPVHALPDHRLDLGALVLEREIAMAGGVGAAEAGDLAADPDMAIGVLHRPLQGLREFGDGEFGRVVKRFRRRHRQSIRHFGVRPDVKDFRLIAPSRGLIRRVLCNIEFSIKGSMS